MWPIFEEFKKFALRGNAMDLAIGVVIGAAFNSIVNSFVANIITPLLGVLIGNINFEKLIVRLPNDVVLEYGLFLQSVVAFCITAIALFVIVKTLNRLAHIAHLERRSKKKEDIAAKSPELVVLEEIRDSLKKR